ncbi:nucleophile aminohydrolase [Ephemerocybe angulata]|uniref:Nucleophile aminohydrolase n=1 Tax=Ephemerocybe angulata TaxID=980116 RepID=A0A8H6I4E7_9AGAR|nr:nucleophile aminohydrolase [Tulosesus angulatus]
MELHALQSGHKPRAVTAMTMLKQMLFRYQGHVGAALVLGGVDSTGPHLFTIHPHGSTDKLPYVTMGSGSLAAMAVFESGWQPKMEVRFTSVDLIPWFLLLHLPSPVARTSIEPRIAAGIFNDFGSGSNVDACIITANSTEMLRNVEMPNVRVQKERDYKVRRGTTGWKKIRSLVMGETTDGGRGSRYDLT